jgi:hypothetical protein
VTGALWPDGEPQSVRDEYDKLQQEKDGGV